MSALRPEDAPSANIESLSAQKLPAVREIGQNDHVPIFDTEVYILKGKMKIGSDTRSRVPWAQYLTDSGK